MSQPPTEQSAWEDALNGAFPDGVPRSTSFTSRAQIAQILRPFCRLNSNHLMIPSGGGQSILTVTDNRSDKTLEFCLEPRVAFVCNPTEVFFENIEGQLDESFFLIECGDLEPSDAYGEVDKAEILYEEVVELDSGVYLDRGYWDQGIEGHDEDGNEIPMRDSARLLTRFWGGKFLLVFKRSIWNRTNETYDGRHGELTSEEIRQQIESAIEQGRAPREAEGGYSS